MDEFQPIDLEDADDCREFLRSLIVNGKKVTKFHTDKGRKLTVDEMTDEQAINFANQLHKELFNEAEYVDTRLDRILN